MREIATHKINVGLYILGYYGREMEGLLRQGQDDLSRKILETLGSGFSLESVNPIIARDFPRYLRYSFIALLVSFTEDHLQELCIEVGKCKGLSEKEVKDALKENGKVKNSKHFMKEHLKDYFSTTTRPEFLRAVDKLYEPILFLVRVRNCILHSSGYVTKLKRKEDQQELLKGVNRYSGFIIADDSIVLEREFCKVGKEVVQNLFTQLFTLLPRKTIA